MNVRSILLDDLEINEHGKSVAATPTIVAFEKGAWVSPTGRAETKRIGPITLLEDAEREVKVLAPRTFPLTANGTNLMFRDRWTALPSSMYVLRLPSEWVPLRHRLFPEPATPFRLAADKESQRLFFHGFFDRHSGFDVTVEAAQSPDKGATLLESEAAQRAYENFEVFSKNLADRGRFPGLNWPWKSLFDK